jgi:hypothetical protein
MLRQAGAEDAALILFCIDGDQISSGLPREPSIEAFPQCRDLCARLSTAGR